MPMATKANEPVHEIFAYGSNEDSDEPAHLWNITGAFNTQVHKEHRLTLYLKV